MRRKTVAARLFLATSSCALASAAPPGETITYSYDALGRLVATSSSGTVNNGLATSIAYDAAGNRLGYGVSGASAGGSGGGGGGGTVGPVTVADFSFENPPLASGTYVETPTVAGVTFTGWSSVTSNLSAWGYAAAPAGTQAAFLSGQNWALPTMSLAVTGLTPGATYRVSFMMASRPYYGPPTVHVTIGGTVLGDYSPLTSTNAFTSFSTSAFTATSSSATLTFAFTTLGDTAIDKVSVAP